MLICLFPQNSKCVCYDLHFSVKLSTKLKIFLWQIYVFADNYIFKSAMYILLIACINCMHPFLYNYNEKKRDAVNNIWKNQLTSLLKNKKTI